MNEINFIRLNGRETGNDGINMKKIVNKCFDFFFQNVNSFVVLFICIGIQGHRTQDTECDSKMNIHSNMSNSFAQHQWMRENVNVSNECAHY